ELPNEAFSVVSRGGRPDLAADALPKVKAPTLLIVGGEDQVVIELNEQARAQMKCECKINIVPGATHLFEEPGTLEKVAKMASHSRHARFFLDHEEDAQRVAGRRDRPLQNQKGNLRASHLRKQRPQFSGPRFCDRARPAAISVDLTLPKKMSLDLALPHRSL